MRSAPALFAALLATPAAAQVLPLDPAAALRLQNEQRFFETRQRALEADLGRLRTDQTVRQLQNERLPDPILSRRQSDQNAAEADALLRAGQAQSTARAARLRTGLGALGYADTLPLAPVPADPPR